MEWMTDQKKAIDSRRGNFLVSAGAGSGKTAVLTERIKQIVLEGQKEKRNNTPLELRKGAEVNQLLVLTFTNKAAAEMKSRIREALFKAYQNGELLEDVSSQVEAADITTFDSFFYSFVRKYHYELGIDADIVIVDKSFLELETRNILDDVFMRHYEEKKPEFLKLISHFCGKEDDKIKNIVLALLNVASYAVEPKAFLSSIDQKFVSSPAAWEKERKEWLEYQRERVGEIADNIECISSKELYDYLSSLLDPLMHLKDADDFQGMAEAYGKTLPASLKNARFRVYEEDAKPNPKYIYLEEEDMLLGRALLSSIKKLVKEAKGYPLFDDFLLNLEDVRPYALEISSLALEVYEAIERYKRENNAYDFADIAALAREALANEEIRSSIRSSYKYIMVDEYQDTSDLQEDFLKKISSDNLFAVGDMKQSIYRFRHANPDIFLQRFMSYEKQDGGELIVMNNNFRSSPNVISDVNSFFGEMMSKRMGGIAYDASQRLVFANTELYGTDKRKEYMTDVISYKKEEDDDRTLAEIEAHLIAKDILSRVGKEYVVDKDSKDKKRLAEYKDFVILCRKKAAFDTYLKIFSEYKIPSLAVSEKDLSNEDVILLFKRFLRLFLAFGCDEAEEKHSYASIMRSYLYREKDEKIAQDILTGDYRHTAFWKEFASFYQGLTKMSPSQAVESLFRRYPFFAKLPSIGNVVENYEKMRTFSSLASSADRLGMDFKAFCSYFLELERRDVKEAVDLPIETDSAVRIMSIHASKGLEFPFVYLSDNSRDMKMKNNSAADLKVSNHFGLLFTNKKEGANIFSILDSFKENKDAVDEEIRILYVALTRAKQKLIILREIDERKGRIALPHSMVLFQVKDDGKIASPTIAGHKRYRDFLESAKVFHHFGRIVPPEPSPLEAKGSDESSLPKPILRSIQIEAKEPKRKRASKDEKISVLDYEKIAYGLKMHRLLECVSFLSKDLSFMEDGPEKRKIAAILANPFFSNLQNAKEYHEYQFYDEEEGIRGSIDLLIVTEQEAYIIDFKSKDISDPAYSEQLAAYRSYVRRTFAKPSRTFLLSIASSSLTEIK